MAACGVFLAARSTGDLYLARSLQGIASGLATGPTGAALLDLQRPGSGRAPLVTSVFSSLGLALGALVTSVLVQFAPAPTHLIWWVLMAVFAADIVAVLFMAEPGSRRPGVLASLRPRVVVPPAARRTFAAAVPAMVTGWALGGLYLSLGPTLAAQATGSPDLIWGGLVIFLLCGTGAAAAFALRRLDPHLTMLAWLPGPAGGHGRDLCRDRHHRAGRLLHRQRDRGRRLRPGLPGLLPRRHPAGRAR